jgi:hypothetical protein
LVLEIVGILFKMIDPHNHLFNFKDVALHEISAHNGTENNIVWSFFFIKYIFIDYDKILVLTVN